MAVQQAGYPLQEYLWGVSVQPDFKVTLINALGELFPFTEVGDTCIVNSGGYSLMPRMFPLAGIYVQEGRSPYSQPLVTSGA
jgi:hypothetical protein